jgi:hypothetical protein
VLARPWAGMVYIPQMRKKRKRKKEKEKEFTNCGLFIDYTQVYYKFDCDSSWLGSALLSTNCRGLLLHSEHCTHANYMIL